MTVVLTSDWLPASVVLLGMALALGGAVWALRSRAAWLGPALRVTLLLLLPLLFVGGFYLLGRAAPASSEVLRGWVLAGARSVQTTLQLRPVDGVLALAVLVCVWQALVLGRREGATPFKIAMHIVLTLLLWWGFGRLGYIVVRALDLSPAEPGRSPSPLLAYLMIVPAYVASWLLLWPSRVPERKSTARTLGQPQTPTAA